MLLKEKVDHRQLFKQRLI